MIRGTTPTLRFTLPFACSNITKLSVAFSQNDQLVLEKDISACQMQDNVVTVRLTEDETLMLKCGDHRPGMVKTVEIQLRVGCGETRLASQIWTVPVGRILKEGCL